MHGIVLLTMLTIFYFLILLSCLHNLLCNSPSSHWVSLTVMASISTMTQTSCMSTGPKQPVTRDLQSYALFSRRFTKKVELGKVKTPRQGESSRRAAHAQDAIRKEIALLKTLGKHDNILGMLASCKDFKPMAPAIFFQVADLGDLIGYCMRWHSQQGTLGLSQRIPEITILKFMHDMILALEFLHNGSRCWVHTDIKPDNILVVTPPTYTGGDITVLPTFKLGDLSRMLEYPSTSNCVSGFCEWAGTFEFAPPISERLGPSKPSSDIWGLGATVQGFALGITPVISKVKFITDRMQAGESYPDIKDYPAWAEEYWRALREVVYRPLNISLSELVDKWDIDTGSSSFRNIEAHVPYSEGLNQVYEMMLEPESEARVSAAHLAKYAVPFLAEQILVEEHLDLAEEYFHEQGVLLPLEPEGKIAARFRLPKGEGFVQFPAYDGAGHEEVY
ncbi:hypothetical protein HBI56_078610 [Parastagonospora nodorum]|nr:hypothetical protein HBH56_148570 [Parastagonospora nodorum]KAH3923196.1 hypothetical protein HBH54_213210 [Parastagonospora nodorum]KAH3945999.1 hypothetical protein HBH53_136020 [Parastagonospora nodorum]KAH3983813.1 hypothetical protein HBH52_063990 [Parastagonospora nodorum]KAH3985610.1 hypothetical protein HBH51_022760 [Parastagonospora nodorum]